MISESNIFKDGLIFRFFASMNSRGVPACANFWLSLTAAFCALYFSLEVLVEMMSIGTLLAYTLVDACVLILRYQHSRQQRSQPAFIELLNGRDNTVGFYIYASRAYMSGETETNLFLVFV